MNEISKILHGEAWAARLQGHLSAPPNAIEQWMPDHTYSIKKDKYSYSGLLRLGGDLCFLKFYAHKSPVRRLFSDFYTPRAVRAFQAAAALRWHGIAVPRPRACLQIRAGYLLLTKGIEGSESLEYLWQGGVSDELGSHLMWAAGAELGQLHSAGYCHGDGKWSNFLWGRERLYVVDLDGTGRAPLRGSKQARDLARFTIDAEELGVDNWFYEQFLESYMRATNWDRDDLQQRLQPQLDKLRNRHWARYGAYPQRLA